MVRGDRKSGWLPLPSQRTGRELPRLGQDERCFPLMTFLSMAICPP